MGSHTEGKLSCLHVELLRFAPKNSSPGQLSTGKSMASGANLSSQQRNLMLLSDHSATSQDCNFRTACATSSTSRSCPFVCFFRMTADKPGQARLQRARSKTGEERKKRKREEERKKKNEEAGKSQQQNYPKRQLLLQLSEFQESRTHRLPLQLPRLPQVCAPDPGVQAQESNKTGWKLQLHRLLHEMRVFEKQPNNNNIFCRTRMMEC